MQKRSHRVFEWCFSILFSVSPELFKFVDHFKVV